MRPPALFAGLLRSYGESINREGSPGSAGAVGAIVHLTEGTVALVSRH